MRTFEELTGEADPWDVPPRYLILHKVRGKPAFDVAFQMRFGEEDGWLIPTSGHRAYPVWAIGIETLQGHPGWTCPIDDDWVASWRDHYSITATPKVELTLESLGIKVDHITINRRRL